MPAMLTSIHIPLSPYKQLILYIRLLRERHRGTAESLHRLEICHGSPLARVVLLNLPGVCDAVALKKGF